MDTTGETIFGAMTASEIYREIARVEDQIESGEGKGKMGALKAYHSKLGRAYMKAISGR